MPILFDENNEDDMKFKYPSDICRTCKIKSKEVDFMQCVLNFQKCDICIHNPNAKLKNNYKPDGSFESKLHETVNKENDPYKELR